MMDENLKLSIWRQDGGRRDCCGHFCPVSKWWCRSCSSRRRADMRMSRKEKWCLQDSWSGWVFIPVLSHLSICCSIPPRCTCGGPSRLRMVPLDVRSLCLRCCGRCQLQSKRGTRSSISMGLSALRLTVGLAKGEEKAVYLDGVGPRGTCRLSINIGPSYGG